MVTILTRQKILNQMSKKVTLKKFAQIKLPSTLTEDKLTLMEIRKCSKSIVYYKCSTRKEVIEVEQGTR